MSYPPLPSNGETNWGTKFTTWADAIEGGKVEGGSLGLRRDTTVGERIFLNYTGGTTMIYGDTGWRMLGGLLINGWTSASVRIRRINTTVQIQGRINPSEKTANEFLELPVGFRFVAGSFTRGYGLGNGNLILLAGGTLFSSATGTSGDLQEIWFTNDAWPTTLPGTP